MLKKTELTKQIHAILQFESDSYIVYKSASEMMLLFEFSLVAIKLYKISIESYILLSSLSAMLIVCM